jgi:hypothetical protein
MSRKAAVTVKTTDKKARVSLPKSFADHLVIIEQVDETEVRITKARAVPEREMWLWKNPTALGMVLEGLEAAKAAEFAPGPDLDADASLLPDRDEGGA